VMVMVMMSTRVAWNTWTFHRYHSSGSPGGGTTVDFILSITYPNTSH